MPYLAPSISSLQSTERIDRGVTGGEVESQRQSPRTASIHILDDDSLLHVFDLYRPFLLGEDEDGTAHLWGGGRGWVRGRWWYKLAHVCKRWRDLVLGSATYLSLSLVCTYGTPVAEMLAHSPHLPLDIDYIQGDMTADDEEAITLALKQRDRVRRVRLSIPVTSLPKFTVAIDEEYPILEYLVIEPQVEGHALILPESFQAPRLRNLTLTSFSLSIGSRLLTSAVGLVALSLVMVHPSTYLHPNTLLQWILLMPQLESLWILFLFPIPNRDVKRQLTHAPIATPVTLPNLLRITFRGVSTYLEILVHRITAPRLEQLEIVFFNQLTFSVSRLLQFMNTTGNFRFDSVGFAFSDESVAVMVYPFGKTEMYALVITVDCWHLDWQASFATQFSYSFSQMLSPASVEHLVFAHEVHSLSSEAHIEVDPTEWRELLSRFSNVKTLGVGDGLVKDLSRCLELDDAAPPLELLPELRELTYSAVGDTGDAFSSFINARQNVGRPVTLVRE